MHCRPYVPRIIVCDVCSVKKCQSKGDGDQSTNLSRILVEIKDETENDAPEDEVEGGGRACRPKGWWKVGMWKPS